MTVDKELVNISIPKELMSFLNDFYEKDNPKKNLQLQSSIILFLAKKVSFQRAANLAGYSQNEFIDILHTFGISWMEYSDEEYLDDIEALKGIQKD